jgi:hypothetical protein
MCLGCVCRHGHRTRVLEISPCRLPHYSLRPLRARARTSGSQRRRGRARAAACAAELGRRSGPRWAVTASPPGAGAGGSAFLLPALRSPHPWVQLAAGGGAEAWAGPTSRAQGPPGPHALARRPARPEQRFAARGAEDLAIARSVEGELGDAREGLDLTAQDLHPGVDGKTGDIPACLGDLGTSLVGGILG